MDSAALGKACVSMSMHVDENARPHANWYSYVQWLRIRLSHDSRMTLLDISHTRDSAESEGYILRTE